VAIVVLRTPRQDGVSAVGAPQLAVAGAAPAGATAVASGGTQFAKTVGVSTEPVALA
jgi:hypothetical protein